MKPIIFQKNPNKNLIKNFKKNIKQKIKRLRLQKIAQKAYYI